MRFEKNFTPISAKIQLEVEKRPILYFKFNCFSFIYSSNISIINV